jgi:hypothetical protein
MASRIENANLARAKPRLRQTQVAAICGVADFFNRSTSILIGAARNALERSQQISRVEIAGGQSKPFFSVDKTGVRFIHHFIHRRNSLGLFGNT